MVAHIEEKLRSELGAWADAGITARFWWRDDDAVSETPQLRRLLAIAQDTGILPALGVVPERADDSLVELVATTPCSIWQHGWGHDYRQGSGEFGEGRPIDLMIEDALSGQRALDRLFGPSGWQRVFVPPYHLMSMPFKAHLPRLGYLGVSAGVPLTPRLEHVVEVNAEIDVMNWREDRILGEDALCQMVIDQLKSRRLQEVPLERPVGILTHHLAFDEDAWDVVSRIFAFLRSHHAVELVRASTLFEASDPLVNSSPSRSSTAVTVRHPSTAGVTMAITSCGRQDLLVRTLDSFLKYNTYPVREIVVIEDGEAERNLPLEPRYRRHNIRWLSTGTRIGQIAAIDMAYGAIETEYIFHCEDDWEFFAPGFVEKSLCVLNHNPHVVQAWLRALDDTNNCPVMDQLFFAGQIPYRLMRPGHRSKSGGIWDGFSFNPGLKRRRDYELMGSFGSLDPLGNMMSYEVERDASHFYLKQGFLAAILADEGGKGYVRHIGWGRQVVQPGDEPDS